MKRILILAMFIGMMTSCSNDENETTPQTSQLEMDIKKCVEIELGNQSNKGVTPPGLTPFCDCITFAIDNSKTKKQ